MQCFRPFQKLLTLISEGHKHAAHLRDKKTQFSATGATEQRAEQSNIAAMSPGAVGGAKAEHKAAINSMMMERMNTDIYALKKQYARIKRRQQQQAMHLYVRTGGGKGSDVVISLRNMQGHCCQ